MGAFIEKLHLLLDIVEQHGLSVVLAVVAFIAIFIIIKWLSIKFDELWRMVVKVQDKLPEERTVESLVIMNSTIKSSLLQTMLELKADWCQLWQFHNGTHGVGRNRIPFMFISLTHEVCSGECEAMRPQFSQLPLSMFDKFAEDLIKGDLLIHQFKKDAKPEPSMMGKMVHEFGANLGFLRAIRDEDNCIIGFMVAAFKNSHTITEMHKTQFLNGTQRMAAILASQPDEIMKK